MNVAVLNPTPRSSGAEFRLAPAPAVAIPHSEWIDPEGDDWLAAIYRELTQAAEPGLQAERDAPEPEHWFG